MGVKQNYCVYIWLRNTMIEKKSIQNFKYFFVEQSVSETWQIRLGVPVTYSHLTKYSPMYGNQFEIY